MNSCLTDPLVIWENKNAESVRETSRSPVRGSPAATAGTEVACDYRSHLSKVTFGISPGPQGRAGSEPISYRFQFPRAAQPPALHLQKHRVEDTGGSEGFDREPDHSGETKS